MFDSRHKDIRNLPGFGLTATLAVVFLYLPVIFLAAYSFNDGRSISRLDGVSLRWYVAVWQNETIHAATINSLIIVTIAASVSTVFATAAALAMVRRQFRAKPVAFAIINLPLMVPEIVTALATLIFFATIGIGIGLGLGAIIIAHIVFCIPFAFLPIRARLVSMDPKLEAVSADLFATPLMAFRKVTLPLLVPGLLSGWLLAFIVSLDDFIISAMLSGPGSTTLPVHTYSMLRLGITPEVNAVSSLMIIASTILVVASGLIARNLPK